MRENLTAPHLAVEAVQDLQNKIGMRLITMNEAADHLATYVGISTATARKHLRTAIEQGMLLEIKPNRSQGFATPTANERIKENIYRVFGQLSIEKARSTPPAADGSTTGWAIIPGRPSAVTGFGRDTFVLDETFRKDMVRHFNTLAKERIASEREKQKAETEAKDQEHWSEAAAADPELVHLLGKLRALHPGIQTRPLVLRNADGIHTWIEISPKATEIFKDLLRPLFTPFDQES